MPRVGTGPERPGSIALYSIAVPLAFVCRPTAIAIYISVIALWLVPDRRMVRAAQGEAPLTP